MRIDQPRTKNKESAYLISNQKTLSPAHRSGREYYPARTATRAEFTGRNCHSTRHAKPPPPKSDKEAFCYVRDGKSSTTVGFSLRLEMGEKHRGRWVKFRLYDFTLTDDLRVWDREYP
jgi:hypothetical protein